MTLEPLKKYVLVEVPKVEDKHTESGIVIAAEHQKQAPQEAGKVMAVGEEVKIVAVGDVVVFGRFNRSEITIDEQKYIVVLEDNLIAKIKS